MVSSNTPIHMNTQFRTGTTNPADCCSSGPYSSIPGSYCHGSQVLLLILFTSSGGQHHHPSRLHWTGSLPPTLVCLVWLRTPGSHFPWLVCYNCALCSPLSLSVIVPMSVGRVSCFSFCAACLVHERVSSCVVLRGLPSLFSMGTSQCFVNVLVLDI